MTDKHRCLSPELFKEVRKGMIGRSWSCPCGQAWEIHVNYLGPIEGITARRAKSV